MATTGNYAFTIWAPDRNPAFVPIAFGQTQPVSITVRGDVAWVSFQATQEQVGKPLSVVLSPERQGHNFQAHLELAGPDGWPLAALDNYNANGWGTRIRDFVLPVSGAYTVSLWDLNNDNTGLFTLGLNRQPVSEPEPLPGFNTQVTGRIDSLGDVDEYAFGGQAGQVVTVERKDGNFTDLTLYGPDGSLVAGAGDNDTLLDLVTLPSSGQYKLRVQPAGGATGSAVAATGKAGRPVAAFELKRQFGFPVGQVLQGSVERDHVAKDTTNHTARASRTPSVSMLEPRPRMMNSPRSMSR